MLDLHTAQHGYTEVLPPYMVNSKSLFGTGQLPKFAEDLFHCDDKGAYDPGEFQDGDHWLIPTAEVPVTNLFRDETLEEAQLPISLLRVHAVLPVRGGQLRQGCSRDDPAAPVPEGGAGEVLPGRRSPNAEHERLTRMRSAVLELLGLPYRRMLLCTGDMGFCVGEDLRPGGLAAGAGAVPRDIVVLEL